MNAPKLALIGGFALLAACSSSNDSAVESNEVRDVSIAFTAEANNVAIDCDTQLTGLGTQNTNAALKEFRIYVHDVALLDDQGNAYSVTLDANEWQYQNLALLDLMSKDTSCSGAAKPTNTAIAGEVSVPPNTALTQVRFTLGVPNALNHQDRATAPAPLDAASMHWNWQNGYKFARFDIAPLGGISRPSDAGFSSTTWNFHLGSTNCVGDPQLNEAVTCGRPNLPVIELTNFDATSDTVVIDYGKLVESQNVSQDLGGASGCMSGATDPECAAIFTALGLDVSTGKADANLTQTVFRVN
jgi:uncharacterized repeat protein (TIGR04052 family)